MTLKSQVLTRDPHPSPLEQRIGYLRGGERRLHLEDFEELFFRKLNYYKQKKIELIFGHKAIRINRKEKTITLDDGRVLGYERLLISTGGRPRKLHAVNSDPDGIFYLRTIDDSIAIRQSIPDAKNAVIVGGGFIGCEVAASLTTKGVNTTIIEVLPQILGKAVDKKTSDWIKRYHEEKGTKILTEKKVIGFVGQNGHVKAVKLESGEEIQADMVVVGIGIELNTGIVKESGLEVDNSAMAMRSFKPATQMFMLQET